MKDYLKKYSMVLHTIGPVHVGSGQSLSKKEYVLQKKQGKVLIPDLGKLYQQITKVGKQKEFEKYLFTDGRNIPDLGYWLRENSIPASTFSEWVHYELACGDFLQEKGTIQIMLCQKDNYGLPYIPGSSLKGMIRTILLAYELCRKRDLCGDVRSQVPFDAKKPASRKQYLMNCSRAMEESAFHTLNRMDKNGKAIPKGNAVNDCMSGIIVSDSDPLKLEDLILCQKRDEDVKGNQHALNLLRESIKPERDIRFTITIDSQLCKYSIEDIFQAVKVFNEFYYEMYLSYFQAANRPAQECVWLGGGTGFFTKTVLYPLLGKEKGIETAIRIFEQTINDRGEHKHFKDKQLGVSPHILKCTQYQGKRYQMGMCKLRQE